MRRKRRIADVFDFAAPLPGIGICAVRIGNFINGELWGKPTDVPWGFMVDGEVRHASQLYEAALEGLVLFIILWWYTAKPRPRMAPTGLFLVIYSLRAHHRGVLARAGRAHRLPRRAAAGSRWAAAVAADAAHRPHADVHGVSPARSRRAISSAQPA